MENKFYMSMQDFIPLIGQLPTNGQVSEPNLQQEANNPFLAYRGQEDDEEEEDDDDDECLFNDAEMPQHLTPITTAAAAATVYTSDKDQEKQILNVEQQSMIHPLMEDVSPNSSALFYFDRQTAEEDHRRSLLDDEEDVAAMGPIVPSSSSSLATTVSNDAILSNCGQQALLVDGTSRALVPASSSNLLQPFYNSPSTPTPQAPWNNNDQLLHQLMLSYAKQAQELKELKELVRHLQDLIITSNLPSSSLVSATTGSQLNISNAH